MTNLQKLAAEIYPEMLKFAKQPTIEQEIINAISDGTKSPLELVSKVRESSYFPNGIPAQEIIQAMWRLGSRGTITVHTQKGVRLNEN